VKVKAGDRLGPFEVVAPLGAGGMGEVWRARDTRLGRDVAVKVLPGDLAAEPERQRRFEREARAMAALAHPNLIAIFDVGVHQGSSYIVEELLEGQSLRERIKAGALPQRTAVDVAVQIARGLAAAHERGIVHRDLKPENVFVSGDGTVKLLDFGLARLIDPVAPEHAGTRSHLPTGATEPGRVLGTAGYMAPEQVRGLPVDQRADIFSLGVVMYEMLSGANPFLRGTSVETFSAILNDEPPDLVTPPLGAPTPLARLVARLLEKEPGRRFHSAADVAFALESTLSPVGSTSTATAPLAGASRRRWLWRLAALPVVAALGVFALLALREPFPAPPPLRFTPLATEAVGEYSPAWSPDGKAIAYLADVDGLPQVFVRTLDTLTPSQLTHSPVACRRPFWSPDGSIVYFLTHRPEGGAADLRSIGAAGGETHLVREKVGFYGVAIARDSRVAFFAGEPGRFALQTAPSPSGAAASLRRAPFPDLVVNGLVSGFSPDGTRLIVGVNRQTGSTGEAWIVPLDPSQAPRLVFPDLQMVLPTTQFSWLPDSRHVVFDSESQGLADTHLFLGDTVTGSWAPLTSGAGEETQPAVSPDGRRVAFVAGTVDSDLVAVPLDGATPATLLASARQEAGLSWVPPGQQYVYETNATGASEIWQRSRGEGWARQVASCASLGEPNPRALLRQPRVSPDGRRVAVEVFGSTHYLIVVDLAGGRAVRLDPEGRDEHAASWSPDGASLAYRREHEGHWQLVKRILGSDGTLVLGDAASSATAAGGVTAWSPTGAWIAYRQDDGIHLVSPDGGVRRKLSARPALYFDFSRDSSILIALARGPAREWLLVEIDVASGSERRVRALPFDRSVTLSGLSLHPDGRSFATSMATDRRDLWLLEGLQPPRTRGFALFRRFGLTGN
jgi:eukaryotic-like serine/threonine-protein kinase